VTKKALLVPLIALALAGAAAWLFATPYLAVSDMRRAADARDADALADHVDFPALRESLKGEIAARLSPTSGPAAGNPLLAFGAALAGSLVGPAIDAWVTPESLSWLLRGELPPVSGQSINPAADVDASMGYAGASTFVVEVKPKGSQARPIQLVLTRSGIASWKLTAVHLT